MKQNPVTVADGASHRLDEVVEQCAPDRIVVLTDSNVEREYLPSLPLPPEAEVVVLPPGEENKSLGSLQRVWDALERIRATRRSMLINVGGGLISDLGGFAAATFRRGIRFVNVATTLLAAVDASVGGKTGINYAGLKNEVGAFAMPVETIVDVAAFATLPRQEMLSGIGEIYKTAFIAPASLSLGEFITSPENIMAGGVAEAVRKCIRAKTDIVDADPYETGLRRVLNFGHTAGHALEEIAIDTARPLPHGIAVAYGILPALVLSHMLLGLEVEVINRYAALLREGFPPLSLSCRDYPGLIRLMRRDKKNCGDAPPKFILLREFGNPVAGVEVPDKEIETALDITRDYLGI